MTKSEKAVRGQRMTHCTTCPRALTPQERAATFRRCEVCRGVRVATQKPFVFAQKSPQNTGTSSSWWLGLDHEALNREAEHRFRGAGRRPWLLLHHRFGFGEDLT